MKILETMKNNSLGLKKSELVINNYLYKNANNISKLTSTIVAKECFLSTTTVNRFCQKMKCSSFSEFKVLLAQEITNETIIEPINDVDNNIIRFLKEINKDSCIYLVGFGSSLISSMYLFRQLTYLNYKCILLQDPFLLDYIDYEYIIVVSSSGESNQMLNTIKNIDKKKIISLTRKNSSLYNKSNISISHNVTTQILNPIKREQQIHLITLINELCQYLYDNK